MLKALRANGLNVVAIHHHMTNTQPTVYFLHYWGTGAAEKLATGFKAALDQLGKTKPAYTNGTVATGTSDFPTLTISSRLIQCSTFRMNFYPATTLNWWI